MARIAILIDPFVGHFFPTLGLARALMQRGHDVRYLGVPDMAALVREQGCEFTEILTDTLPSGSCDALRRQAGIDPENEKFIAAAQARYFGPLAAGRVLDGLFERWRPDVLLTVSFLGLEALVIRYLYGVPGVLLTPFIRDSSRQEYYRALVSRLLNLSSGVSEFVEMVGASGVRLRSLNDVADLLLEWPDLALYPQAFAALPGTDESGVAYIGAGRSADRQEGAFPWGDLDGQRPIVYCSLGSRPGDYGDVSRRLFATVIEAMASDAPWQAVLSVGPDLGPADFPAAAPHVMIRQWVAQMDVLRRSAVMITHAGMGAVTECILAGVPMVAFPMARDQHENAVRIVCHGLGLSGDVATITVDGLRGMLAAVTEDPSFRERAVRMRDRSRESEVATGVAVVEQALATAAAHPHRRAASHPV